MKKLIKIFGLFLAITMGLVVIVSISTEPDETNNQKNSRELREKLINIQKKVSSGEIKKKKAVFKNYSVLRSWKAGDLGENKRKLNSTGFEILINENLTEEEILEIVREISKKDRTMKINVFSSKDAFNELHKSEFENTNSVKTGYILSLTKSPNGNINGQITWMQEIGKFSKKYGNKEKL